jgi:hypothetical protein
MNFEIPISIGILSVVFPASGRALVTSYNQPHRPKYRHLRQHRHKPIKARMYPKSRKGFDDKPIPNGDVIYRVIRFVATPLISVVPAKIVVVL